MSARTSEMYRLRFAVLLLSISFVLACQQELHRASDVKIELRSSIAVVNNHPAILYLARNATLGISVVHYMRSYDENGFHWPSHSEAVSPTVNPVYDAKLQVIDERAAIASLEKGAAQSIILVAYRRSYDVNGATWQSEQPVQYLAPEDFRPHIAMVESTTSARRPLLVFYGQLHNTEEPSTQPAYHSALSVDADGSKWTVVTIAANIAVPEFYQPPLYSLATLNGSPTLAFFDETGKLEIMHSSGDGTMWQDSMTLSTVYSGVNPILLSLSGGDFAVLSLSALKVDGQNATKDVYLSVCELPNDCDTELKLSEMWDGNVTSLAAAVVSVKGVGDIIAYEYVRRSLGDIVYLNSFLYDEEDRMSTHVRRQVYTSSSYVNVGRFASVTAHGDAIISSWFGGQVPKKMVTPLSIIYNMVPHALHADFPIKCGEWGDVNNVSAPVTSYEVATTTISTSTNAFDSTSLTSTMRLATNGIATIGGDAADPTMIPLFIGIGVLIIVLLIALILVCMWFRNRRLRRIMGDSANPAPRSPDAHRSTTASRASAYRRTEMSRQSARSRGRRRSGMLQGAGSISMSSPRSSSRKSSIKRGPVAADTGVYGWSPVSSTYDVVRMDLNAKAAPTGGTGHYQLVPTKVSNIYESASSPLGSASVYDVVSTPLQGISQYDRVI